MNAQEMSAKDLHLTVQVRNAVMVRWRRERGLSRKAAAEHCGVHQTAWGVYEALKCDPIKRRVKEPQHAEPAWKESAIKIAHGMQMLPDHVFTDGVRSVVQTKIEVEVSSDELQARLADASTMRYRLAYSPNPETLLQRDQAKEAIEAALESLPSRERKVLRMRFWDGMTLKETGAVLGVGKERARQLELKALRLLKHPSRAKPLRDAGANLADVLELEL